LVQSTAGTDSSPSAWIYSGVAGIAYATYRKARARDERRLFELAGAWLRRAFALASDTKAFHDSEITPETVGQVSLFHSICGLHCVDALVRVGLGDEIGSARAIEAFVERSRGPSDCFDLTSGAASLLLGCAELLELAGISALAEVNLLQNRGDEIAEVLSELLQAERIATSTRIDYLGIAHGWAGLAFALLRWTRAKRQPAPPLLATTLDELAELAHPYSGGVCWTKHNNTSSLMPGWCSGTAGYAMLFALAHEVLNVPIYADLAERAASSAWDIETAVGSLCCGNGGNGYAFLAIYRLTGVSVWLERARVAARRALGDESISLFPDSLYRGRLGANLLASELERPATASMPLFEPARFNDEVSK
jgi:hypothetical protein